MACSTLIRGTSSTQATGTVNEWKTMFSEFATMEGSCTFIKKLIAVSVSAITYLRQIFPEEAYGEKDLYGIKLKILSENSGLKSVSKFIDLIRNCYDAVEKKYLHQLCIGVCTDPTKRDEVIEAYTLVFKYKDDVCSVTTNNEKNMFCPTQGNPTVDATLLMLKSILAVNNFAKKLPPNAYLTIKLHYYDDVTPENYEPPGFEAAPFAQFNFPQEAVKYQLGKINTSHHGYQFFFKTLKHESFAICDPEDPVLSQQSNRNRLVPLNDRSEGYTSSQESLSRSKPNVDFNSLPCPCGLESFDEDNSLVCTSCERSQHKSCYGILDNGDIPNVFYCVDCILLNTNGNANLDLVYIYQGDERKKLCMTRRALSLGLAQNSISVLHLEKYLGCDKAVASSLIEQLVNEGFIKKGSGRNRYVLDSWFVNTYGVKGYFPEKDDKENEEATTTRDIAASQIEKAVPLSSGSRITRQTPASMEIEDINSVENTTQKVKNLNINISPIPRTRTKSMKRSLSAVVSPDESAELFRSQKRRRSRKSK